MNPNFVRILAVSALALAPALGAAAPAAAQTETERVDRRMPLVPGGTLKLDNFSGRVRITGADANEVVVSAVRRGTRERLDRVRLEIESSGDTVTIQANKRDRSWFDRGNNNVVETDFDIQVPHETNLQVKVSSSPVTVTGVSGRHEVRSFSATLDLRGLAGPIRAKTFSGDIRLALADAALAPELQLDTFSGDIQVTMPEGASGRIDFRSFSGDLRSDAPLTFLSKSRRRISAELQGGAGGNVIQAKTFSGDFRIRREE